MIRPFSRAHVDSLGSTETAAPVNPVTLVLAARVRADLSDVAGALDKLDGCLGSMWEDPKFRELYLHYVDRIEPEYETGL